MAGLGAVGDATSYVAAAVQVGAPPGVRGGRRDVPRTFNVDGRGRRGGRRGYFKDGRWGGTHACGVAELLSGFFLPCLPPGSLPTRLAAPWGPPLPFRLYARTTRHKVSSRCRLETPRVGKRPAFGTLCFVDNDARRDGRRADNKAGGGLLVGVKARRGDPQ